MVLDIGCGTGVVADELRSLLKIEIEGCDIDKYLIRTIPFKKMKSFNILPYTNNIFNYSMFNDVLHHTSYKNQKALIMESLRVSKYTLVFELIPNRLGINLDFILNKIHNPKMNIPHTYRTPEEWQLLFKKMNLNYAIQNVKPPWWYPFKHIAFKLSLK
jgi:ubiquinone/menaquinone biosynthesis C-methylase UbiE